MSTPHDNPYQPEEPRHGDQSAPDQVPAYQNPQWQQPQDNWSQPGPPLAPPEGNTAGVVALVAGILSWFICPLVAGIVAIIYGQKSKKLAAQGEATNGALGQIGFWLGVVNVVVTVLAILTIGAGIVLFGLVAASSGA